MEKYRADLAILTEYQRGRAGDKLRSLLEKQGLLYQHAPSSVPRKNGVLIASRVSTFRPVVVERDTAYLQCLVCVEISSVRVLGCYFPQLKEKYPVFEAVLDWSRKNGDVGALIMGDFNTGKHHTDEQGATFYGAKYLDQVESIGYTDAWRFLNGSRTEYSWYSSRGNGFRIDHAFVNKPLLPLLMACFYSHRERERGISDHSILVVDLRDGTT